MTVVTVSMKRHPKGNIFDFLGHEASAKLKGLLFHGFVRREDAPMEDGQGSLDIYTLSRTINSRTYHARMHDVNKDKVGELLYSLPTGDYEIFLAPGFKDENLFIRFSAQLFVPEED